MPNVLVTGGAGYIGSHTVVELVAAGWSVTIVDNFHNSSQEALRRIHAITGKRIQAIDTRHAKGAVMEKSTFGQHKFKLRSRR